MSCCDARSFKFDKPILQHIAAHYEVGPAVAALRSIPEVADLELVKGYVIAEPSLLMRVCSECRLANLSQAEGKHFGFLIVFLQDA